MAYQIKGGVIINDSRSLIGVGTAGINTAFYVGDQIQADAASGILTATGFVGDGSNLTGIVTTGGGGDITGDFNITGNLNVTGITTLNTLEISQLTFTGGDPDERFTGITTSLDESATAAEAVTAFGVKKYVDDNIGAANQLNFVGDGGVQGEIDLATEVLDLQGTANEIDTNVDIVGGNQITFKLSNDLVAPGTLAVTGISTFNNNVEIQAGSSLGIQTSTGTLQQINTIGVSTNLAEGGTTNNSTLPTERAVKEYVDASVSGGAGSATLNIRGDGGANVPVNLQAGNIDFTSTADQIDVTVTQGATTSDSDTVNVALVNAPIIVGNGAGDSLAVGPTLGDLGGNILTISGTGATANVTVEGDLQATDINSTSDIRKKDNIVEITDAVTKIKALRGVTFDWKNGSGTSGGVIAQEVEAVLPTLVKEGDDHKTVIYNGLIGLLVQAVKEQAEQIAALQEKLS